MFRTVAMTLVSVATLMAGSAEAATVQVDAFDNGFYRSNDTATTGNFTFTGYHNGSGLSYRSFYAFDLAGNLLPANETVTSATLTFRSNGMYDSADASETIEIYDFGGSSSAIVARTPGINIYDDLGTGSLFGSATVTGTAGSAMPVITVTLSDAAIAEINDAFLNGDTFVLGAMLSSLSTTGMEALFAGSNLASAAFLTVETAAPAVTTVALPATLPLFLVGVGVFALSSRRRRFLQEEG